MIKIKHYLGTTPESSQFMGVKKSYLCNSDSGITGYGILVQLVDPSSATDKKVAICTTGYPVGVSTSEIIPHKDVLTMTKYIEQINVYEPTSTDALLMLISADSVEADNNNIVVGTKVYWDGKGVTSSAPATGVTVWDIGVADGMVVDCYDIDGIDKKGVSVQLAKQFIAITGV